MASWLLIWRENGEEMAGKWRKLNSIAIILGGKMAD